MKSCVFVFLIALLAHPCTGHPRDDKAAFLLWTKHHCWLKGWGHFCQPRGFPTARQLCDARDLVCQAGSSSFLWRSGGAEFVLPGWDGRDHLWPSQTGEASYCMQDIVKPSRLTQGRERWMEGRARRKGASAGGTQGFLQHWQGSTWSSICSVLHWWKESISAPQHTHRHTHAAPCLILN